MNSLILISPSKTWGFQPAAIEDCFGRRTLPANSYNNSSIRYPGRHFTSSTAAIYFVDEFAKSLETPLVVLGAVCDWRSPCY
ncbi:MAG: hypothetical protein EAZ94_20175 [Oscillatoriales cyanobacterium]|nr:MAG: hypothetical protein EAZ94_20175 [Oscillatoriales cyanobacterium]